MAVGQKPGAAKKGSPKALARLHRLHGQVLAHRLRNRIDVLTGLQALLREKLDLGTSTLQLARSHQRILGRNKTCRFWNQI